MAERPERVDLRSYERQGLDTVPTVHMGSAVTQMERRGIATNIKKAETKKSERRMQTITGIQKAVADCNKTKATHDKYLKIGWKTRQAAFAESHKDELDKFNKAYRYLKKQGIDLNVNLDALQAEYDKLKASHAELSRQLAAVNEELKPMKDIRRWVGKVLSPEQSEIECKSEPKHSIAEKMRYYQEKEKGETQGKAKAMEQEVL